MLRKRHAVPLFFVTKKDFSRFFKIVYCICLYTVVYCNKKCSVVKRVDTFLNTIFRKDRITPAFPCRTPLFHLVYNHQAKSEGV